MSESATKILSLARLGEELRLTLYRLTTSFVQLPIFAKVPAVIFLGLGMGTGLNLLNHNAHWNHTIYSVQTVDFNILANVLPAAVKTPLIEQDRVQLNRILNSNYSFFGIIVSRCESDRNCEQERFISSSGFKILDSGSSIRLFLAKPRSWQASRAWTGILQEKATSRQSFLEHLKKSESVIVQGVYRESNLPDFVFESSGSRQPKQLTNNAGLVRVGNIYFIRNTMPPLLDELAASLDRLRTTESTTVPAFLSTRQGVIAQTYLWSGVMAILFWAGFELIAAKSKFEQQEKEVKLQAQVNELQAQKIEFFRVRFAINYFSNELAGFAHNLRNAGQQVVSIMDELALRTKVDMCSIVHDINKAPLLGSSDDQFNELILLLKNSKHPADQQTCSIIQKLKSTRDQLGFVVSDMRSASNTSPSSVIRVNSLLERLKSRIPPIENNDQIKLIISNCSPDAAVSGNEWQIFCIFRNIYYNSVAATKKKRANMRKSARSLFTPEFKLTARVIGSYVEFEIEDNGPGISPEKLETLYQWMPDTAKNLGADRLSGYGSDIVGTYLWLNNASVRVSNITASDNTLCGSKVSLRFKSIPLAS